MTYEEISLILKALTHYEVNCATDEILARAKQKMMIWQMAHDDDEGMADYALKLQDECESKVQVVAEQITLLKAKLIMERDKALADEAIS